MHTAENGIVKIFRQRQVGSKKVSPQALKHVIGRGTVPAALVLRDLSGELEFRMGGTVTYVDGAPLRIVPIGGIGDAEHDPPDALAAEATLVVAGDETALEIPVRVAALVGNPGGLGGHGRHALELELTGDPVRVQRRDSVRVVCRMPARVALAGSDTVGDDIAVEVFDLSATGAGLASDVHLPVGASLIVGIETEAGPFEAYGTVVRRFRVGGAWRYGIHLEGEATEVQRRSEFVLSVDRMVRRRPGALA